MAWKEYIDFMPWDLVLVPKFEERLDVQNSMLRNDIVAELKLLEKKGTFLGRSKVDTLKGAKLPNLMETNLPPESQERINEKAKKLIAHELSLQEMRKALAISQTEMAARLELGQGDISKFERREDVYVSSVRKYLEAMGGKLELIVKFPEKRRYRIKNIGELADNGI